MSLKNIHIEIHIQKRKINKDTVMPISDPYLFRMHP